MAFATSFVRDCCSSGQHEPLSLAMSVSLRCSTSNMFSEANVDFYQQEHLVISGITITEVYVIGPSQMIRSRTVSTGFTNSPRGHDMAKMVS